MLRRVRSSLLSISLGFVFAHLNFLIPVIRLCETSTLLAFYHPRPGYPVHIVIVPKKAPRNLAALTLADSAFLIDLFQTAHSLATELKLQSVGYQLITNGGAYQTLPLLHAHRISTKRPLD